MAHEDERIREALYADPDRAVAHVAAVGWFAALRTDGKRADRSARRGATTGGYWNEVSDLGATKYGRMSGMLLKGQRAAMMPPERSASYHPNGTRRSRRIRMGVLGKFVSSDGYRSLQPLFIALSARGCWGISKSRSTSSDHCHQPLQLLIGDRLPLRLIVDRQ